MKTTPINLYNVHLLECTPVGDLQCDQHLRDNNKRAGKAQKQARKHLVKKLTPFVWLEDQNLDVATFAETVAGRLLRWSKEERARRIAACPEGFEYLLEQ